MKESLIVLSAFVSLISTVYAEKSEPNNLDVPKVVDIGTCAKKKNKEFSIPIKNNTDKSIEVERVFYTCSCFEKIDKAPLTLKTGVTRKFKVRFLSEGLKEQIKKTVWVKSDGELDKVVVKVNVIEK